MRSLPIYDSYIFDKTHLWGIKKNISHKEIVFVPNFANFWQTNSEFIQKNCAFKKISSRKVRQLMTKFCDFQSNNVHTCNFSANCSSDFHGIPQSLKFLIANFSKTMIYRYRTFGFSHLMVISNKIRMQSIIKLT